MKLLSDDMLRATADKLIAAHEEASRTNDWLFFVDEIYARDCVYTCQYAGVMDVTANGIDDIKATHYGRDMNVGWEGWTFPYLGVYIGADNKLVTHWMNRGQTEGTVGVADETETRGATRQQPLAPAADCCQYPFFSSADNIADAQRGTGCAVGKLSAGKW